MNLRSRRREEALKNYPEGVTENSPGLRRVAGRYPGYRPQIKKFPLPFRRAEGQGEGSDFGPLIPPARPHARRVTYIEEHFPRGRSSPTVRTLRNPGQFRNRRDRVGSQSTESPYKREGRRRTSRLLVSKPRQTRPRHHLAPCGHIRKIPPN